MALDSNQVLLNVRGPANELLVSKPFPTKEAAEAWLDGYQKTGLNAVTHRKLTYEVVNLPPRI